MSSGSPDGATRGLASFMGPPSCAVCGATDTEPTTVTVVVDGDETTAVDLCRECESRLAVPRCRICGGPITADTSRYLRVDREWAASNHLYFCRRCHRDLGAETGVVRRA